ncbi:protein lethal(2)essential for life-like [Leptopilina boulardi]|uniref:protein lethal(2)essential for life-like n=1 Tax=Leptopilina boulardi TaxID=63433 RepID=UPI0021F5E1EE|nr:protein lethal(2)essential for life-like [Leptopilina boulardi]XP_051173891.1 protein lethal(2)essential for life-like [Leptopilina boulardi]
MRTLLPLLLSAWWADLDRPHLFLDQDMGQITRRFDDLMFPEWSNRFYLPSILDRSTSLDFFDRNWADILRPKDSGSSIITADKNNFQLILDVQNFKPNEIKVKIVDRFVIVEAKHEEKEDDKKVNKLHFVKKYFVPDQVDIENIKSTLSTDGILMITAPIKKVSEDEKKETLIPIEETGKPAILEKPKNPEELTTTKTTSEEKNEEEVTVETVDESISEK